MRPFFCLPTGHGSHSPYCIFFFNDTSTTDIYTLSLHDALPISPDPELRRYVIQTYNDWMVELSKARSEEHTSELQSLTNLVCRLLLEKKKKEQIGRKI